jgi:hypothetical protein
VRLQGVIKFKKRFNIARKSEIFYDMGTSYRLHDVLMSFLCSFYGILMRSAGVLIGDCASSDCASTAFFALPLRFHGAHTAMKSQGSLKARYTGPDAQSPYKRRRSFGNLSLYSCCVVGDSAVLLLRPYSDSTSLFVLER